MTPYSRRWVGFLPWFCLWALLLCAACAARKSEAVATPQKLSHEPRASVRADASRATLARARRDAEVSALVAPLAQRYGDAAVVVGVVDADGDAFYGFGRKSERAPHAPDADTRFEIGSITKLFIGHLLADMVLRSEVTLDDEAQAYLPSELVLPRYRDRSVTLVDLITHTSGLSQLPWDNPAVRRDRGEVVAEEESIGHPRGTTYTRERLARALLKERLDAPPGSRYGYSSTGIGILAIALGERVKTPLSQLLRQRVTGPLGMRGTHFFHEVTTFDDTFAEGHDDGGKAVWMRRDQEALEGCCGLRSSARDLAAFVRAQFESGPLEDVARLTQTPLRFGGNTYRERIGFAWHLLRRPEGRMYKLGQMRGYRAFVEVDRRSRRGVIVLAAHASWPVEDVVRALLPREVTTHKAALRPVQDVDTRKLPSLARWQNELDLVSLDVPRQVRAGQTLHVRALLRGPLRDEALSMFAHFDGMGGRLKADIPFSTALPDAAYAHELTLALEIPADYPEGEITFYMGFFGGSGRVPIAVGEDDGERRYAAARIQVMP